MCHLQCHSVYVLHTFFPACLSTMAPSLSLPGLAMVWHLTSCDSYSTVGSSCTWRQNTAAMRMISTLPHHSLTGWFVLCLCTRHWQKEETSLKGRYNKWQLVTKTVYGQCLHHGGNESGVKKGHLTPERSGVAAYETGRLQRVSQLCFRMYAECISNLGFLLKFPLHF